MHRVGTPSANSSVSETSATSAFSFVRVISGTYFGDAFAADFFFALDQKFDVQRKRAVRCCARSASTALMCMYIWPLSSQAPRA